MSTKKKQPMSPGEILRRHFMEELDISIDELARGLNITPIMVKRILTSRSRITAELAIRLSYYFKNSPELWLIMQQNYDLGIARIIHGSKIRSEVRPYHRRRVALR